MEDKMMVQQLFDAPYRQFSTDEIKSLAQKYSYLNDTPPSLEASYLTKEQFIRIATWKSNRPRKFYDANSEAYIKEITEAAFAPNSSEEFRINVLTLLKGVQYPMASAILHFGLNQNYPIIDVRALETLWGYKKPIRYSIELWLKYLNTCREIVSNHPELQAPKETPIRILDKALWQWSSKKPKPTNKRKI